MGDLKDPLALTGKRLAPQSVNMRLTATLHHLDNSAPEYISSSEKLAPQISTRDTESTAEAHRKYFPENRPFNPHNPVRVIIVGAGIAGIAAAILIPRKVPNLSFTIFEKNATVGGTWAENVYPGVRCDVPSHVYQLSFAPNLDWSEYYPKGAEIRQYYQRIIKEYGVEEHLHLRHEVLHASWSDEKAEWEVVVKDLASGEIRTDHANFLVSAQGRLNKWKYPDIPGLQSKFQGKLFHTANYETSFEPQGKRIAIIGNGASGQQLLPNILPEVAHIDHYIRSKTWVTPTFRGNILQATAEQPGGLTYSENQKNEWKEDPASYLKFRKDLETQFHGGWQGSILGSPENEAFRQKCIATMRERVGGDEEWLVRLIPDYAPGCKRPTPAPGYLESLITSKVDFVTDRIVAATETGLVTEDGKFRPVDAIIAATGFTGGFLPRYPTIGQNGVDLAKLWAEDGPIGFPETYFGVMAPGFPNYFFILSAQGNGLGSSVPMQCEISATYIAKAIRKVQSQSYRALQPSAAATAEFNQIVDGYFDDKVVADDCNSWFKLGKGKTRNVLAWPGSGHHRFDILRDPRWEDFDFVRQKGARANRYEYFGNGFTERERRNDKDEITSYLHEVGTIDLTTLHEAWNS